MKVSEKVHHQDGTVTEREFNIELKPGKTNLVWTLAPIDGEPISIRILKSGWVDHGQPMYHVLTEYGPYEETSYSHLTHEQLLDRYPEFSQILNMRYPDIAISGDTISRAVNDADLGKVIRSKSLNSKPLK